MISVASPVFTKMKFVYKNSEYGYTNTPIFDFPSIHLNGNKDSYFKICTAHTLFTPRSNPRIVEYGDGHRFPRCLDDNGFSTLKQFVREQYLTKNDSEIGFEVDYEKYNFEVRF